LESQFAVKCVRKEALGNSRKKNSYSTLIINTERSCLEKGRQQIFLTKGDDRTLGEEMAHGGGSCRWLVSMVSAGTVSTGGWGTKKKRKLGQGVLIREGEIDIVGESKHTY